MSRPIVFGKAESVYVRAVRLTLLEKGVPHDIVDVDVFAPSGITPDYLQRHPFRRIPAFAHGDFALYESGAIARYVDEAFAGPTLQPCEPRERARMNQVLSILDSYCYRTMVWDIFVEHVRAPVWGRSPDRYRIETAWPKAETCLMALQDIRGAGPYLSGPTLSLSDIFAAPMFDYFLQVPESRQRLSHYRGLTEWWDMIAQRPSMEASQPPRS